jgi:hypothetical protein
MNGKSSARERGVIFKGPHEIGAEESEIIRRLILLLRYAMWRLVEERGSGGADGSFCCRCEVLAIS